MAHLAAKTTPAEPTRLRRSECYEQLRRVQRRSERRVQQVEHRERLVLHSHCVARPGRLREEGPHPRHPVASHDDPPMPGLSARYAPFDLKALACALAIQSPCWW